MSSLGLLLMGRGLYSRLGTLDAADILKHAYEDQSDVTWREPRPQVYVSALPEGAYELGGEVVFGKG